MKSLWLKNERAFLRFIDVPGDGQALVFLHGLGASAIADFSEAVADSRFREYRCLLVEFLGFGLSDKPRDFSYSLYDHAETIADLLDDLGIAKVIAAGHSMGGTVAIALTQKRPDLVQRLILAEPNLDPGEGSISKVIASHGEQRFVDSGFDKIVRELRLSSVQNPSDAIYLATFSMADPIAIHKSAVGLLQGTRPPQRELLAGMNIPRALIAGEQNVAEFPPEPLRELGLTTHIVPGAGHSMMHDNPKGFLTTLLSALSSP